MLKAEFGAFRKICILKMKTFPGCGDGGSWFFNVPAAGQERNASSHGQNAMNPAQSNETRTKTTT